MNRCILGAVAQAEHTIYLESQYLASRAIAEALANRLCEPEGPETVIVLLQATEGMDRAKGDGWCPGQASLPVLYFATENGNLIYVHAKVMAIDERLRVGS